MTRRATGTTRQTNTLLTSDCPAAMIRENRLKDGSAGAAARRLAR